MIKALSFKQVLPHHQLKHINHYTFPFPSEQMAHKEPDSCLRHISKCASGLRFTCLHGQSMEVFLNSKYPGKLASWQSLNLPKHIRCSEKGADHNSFYGTNI